MNVDPSHSAGWRNALLIVVAIALAYAFAPLGPYQFDDFDAFVDVPAAHTLAAWWGDLGHGLRPLLKLSYLIDWQLGWQAFGFHLTNIAIHLGNALLVWRLAWHCFAHWLPQLDERQRARAALFAALLFALHPAQTEAVTYISGRSTSLMTLFVLLATLAYRRSRWWLAALAFVTAMAVKEPAAITPLLFVLIERCGPAPAASMRLRCWRLAAYIAIPVFAALWLLVHTRYREFLLASLGTRSIADNLLSQLGALPYLAELALGLRYPNLDPSLAEATQWTLPLAITAIALLAAFVLALRMRHTRPWPLFAFGWCVIALLPTNSLLPRYDIVNDRQLYLASVGLVIGFSAELAQRRLFAAPRARWSIPVLAMLCLALLARTTQRNLDYRSEIVLWRATVAASPDQARPLNNLGYAYQLADCDAQAQAAYERAAALDPGYQHARDNLLVLQARPPRKAVCP